MGTAGGTSGWAIAIIASVVSRALSFLYTVAGPHPYPSAATDPDAAELRSAVFQANTLPVNRHGVLDPDASPLDAKWRAFRAAQLADAGARLAKG
jgi:hypothetical protein